MLVQASGEGSTLTCPYCHRSTFKQTSDLRRHIRIHTGEKPFSCNLCGYSGVRREHLNDHMWRKHKVAVTKRTHTTYRVSPDRPILTCPQCPNLTFTYKRNFDRHLRLHSGQRPYQCPQCCYAASRKEHLTSHLFRRHPNTLLSSHPESTL
ncbi:hypothetical protein Pmani_005198 [Petrolisthes manimaculis]|uniref:C2H2-type domain-containing protein n=1 Tax=Petrolisthes manimaculis TaxID=1843537 RepID=A0AAE1QCQ0_9EUCA|nr:hypothetical protein Pmani_005198 [Petrolisthes manimaculis]